MLVIPALGQLRRKNCVHGARLKYDATGYLNYMARPCFNCPSTFPQKVSHSFKIILLSICYISGTPVGTGKNIF
jgi:hypothetical protein